MTFLRTRIIIIQFGVFVYLISIFFSPTFSLHSYNYSEKFATHNLCEKGFYCLFCFVYGGSGVRW